MTRSRATADTQDNTGGAVAPFVSGKNFVINGGFDIWQRGTSFTATGYSADRWYTTAINETLSRQSTNPPVGSQYYMRNTATAGSAASDSFMYFESSQIAPLLGRTVTMSIKVRRNSTFNANLFFRLDKSATVDAGSGATWTTIDPISGSDGTLISTSNSSITTGTGAADWTTIYRTMNIPNDGTANSLRMITYYSAVVPNSSLLDLAQFQLEVGSVPTPFARAGGSIGGELALCQRYCTVYDATNTMIGIAVAASTSAIGRMIVTNPVAWRTAPSITVSGTNLYYDGANTPALGTLGTIYQSQNSVNFEASGTGTLVQYRPYQLWNYTGKIIISAEL